MYKPCPNCNSVGSLRRSRAKNLFESILNFTKIFHIYRCMSCGWRGIVKRNLRIKLSFVGLLKSVILLFLVYYLVTYILKNYTN